MTTTLALLIPAILLQDVSTLQLYVTITTLAPLILALLESASTLQFLFLQFQLAKLLLVTATMEFKLLQRVAMTIMLAPLTLALKESAKTLERTVTITALAQSIHVMLLETVLTLQSAVTTRMHVPLILAMQLRDVFTPMLLIWTLLLHKTSATPTLATLSLEKLLRPLLFVKMETSVPTNLATHLPDAFTLQEFAKEPTLATQQLVMLPLESALSLQFNVMITTSAPLILVTPPLENANMQQFNATTTMHVPQTLATQQLVCASINSLLVMTEASAPRILVTPPLESVFSLISLLNWSTTLITLNAKFHHVMQRRELFSLQRFVLQLLLAKRAIAMVLEDVSPSQSSAQLPPILLTMYVTLQPTLANWLLQTVTTEMHVPMTASLLDKDANTLHIVLLLMLATFHHVLKDNAQTLQSTVTTETSAQLILATSRLELANTIWSLALAVKIPLELVILNKESVKSDKNVPPTPIVMITTQQLLTSVLQLDAPTQVNK
jgi:hypothetical protein